MKKWKNSKNDKAKAKSLVLKLNFDDSSAVTFH